MIKQANQRLFATIFNASSYDMCLRFKSEQVTQSQCRKIKQIKLRRCWLMPVRAGEWCPSTTFTYLYGYWRQGSRASANIFVDISRYSKRLRHKGLIVLTAWPWSSLKTFRLKCRNRSQRINLVGVIPSKEAELLPVIKWMAAQCFFVGFHSTEGNLWQGNKLDATHSLVSFSLIYFDTETTPFRFN